jgi:hypothetical protein
VTVEQYRARIRGLGLQAVKPSRGRHTLHQGRDGILYPIKDPEYMSPEQRLDAVEEYELQFKPR